MCVDVVLEPSNTNVSQTGSGLIVQFVVHLKANGVEQFEQSCEANRLAVVRRG